MCNVNSQNNGETIDLVKDVEINGKILKKKNSTNYFSKNECEYMTKFLSMFESFNLDCNDFGNILVNSHERSNCFTIEDEELKEDKVILINENEENDQFCTLDV